MFVVYKVTIDRGGQTETTGNGENLAGGVGRGITCKVNNRRGNLLRQTDPAKRDMPQE